MSLRSKVTPISAPSTPAWHIGLISFLILILELALIRFIPSEIKAISYFTNIILFASFFGLGFGCILQHMQVKDWVFPVGMFALFGYIYVSRGLVIHETGDSVHFWLQSFGDRYKPIADIPLILSAILNFIFVGLTFFLLGHKLSQALSVHPRLYAYGWDLAGSLVGTLTFAASSFLGFSPIIWLVVVPLIYAWVLPSGKDVRLAATMSGLVFACFAMNQYDTKWSPYYLVNYFASDSRLTVFVNSSFHQEAINFRSKESDYAPLAQSMLQKFSVPYDTYKQHHQGTLPRKVLILGAGTGNDVFVAQHNGAVDITAVEIDPVILGLGKSTNAARPYDLPGVRMVLDDARHFLWNTKEKYDLVVFGTLDSQTLLSGHTNLRLDNYVYTREAFADARHVLVPGGMLATYYSVFKEWFFARIYSTIRDPFQGSLQLFRFQNNYLFNTIIMAAKDLPQFTADPVVDAALSKGIPSSDNWPFIYVESPGLSPLYLQILTFIAAITFMAFLVLFYRTNDRQGAGSLFLMGVGFTLLESAAIVRLSLLFGATWIVSTIVFASALVMMFVGNRLMDKTKISLVWIWPMLGAALMANILIKPALLLGLDDTMRSVAAGLLIGVPVLCASMCFSGMFREEKETGFALGINLIGAMGGGALEYLSMWLGMNSVWIIVLGVYTAAFLFWVVGLARAKQVDRPRQRDSDPASRPHAVESVA